MKKQLLAVAFLGISAALTAQNFVISDGTNNLNSQNVTFWVPQDVQDAHVFTVTNMSSGSMTVKVRKTILQLNTPTATAQFCTDLNCYSPTQSMSINVNMTAGDAFDLTCDFFPDSVSGMAHVRYSVLNQGNPSDSVYFDIYYNATPTGVKESVSVKSSISNPAPNPAVSVFSINYKLGSTPDNSKMVIYDMLGARVMETAVEGQEGTLRMDVSSLQPGIYFCTLESAGKALATRRLVVTH